MLSVLEVQRLKITPIWFFMGPCRFVPFVLATSVKGEKKQKPTS